MCIWIDADSCPVKIRQYVSEAAKKLMIKAVFVANHVISVSDDESPFVEFKLCEAGKDVADNFIFNSLQNSDIVITRDILFAERLVNSDFSVINDRGVQFSKSNIEKYISERNLSLSISMLGLKSGYSKNSYGNKEFSAFCNCFDKLILEKINQALRK